MEIGNQDIQHCRFERKMLALDDDYYLENLIKLHPMHFSEIFIKRSVNNIYLDTLDYKNFYDNIEGLAGRKKVRIRWYGNLFGKIENPTLEIKIKQGLIGIKKSYPLPAAIFDNNSFHRKVSTLLLEKKFLPEPLIQELKLYRPVLINCYMRKYFLSANRQYRITIDSQMKFFQPNDNNSCFDKTFSDPFHAILEIKYSRAYDDDANQITNFFPYRLNAISKYVRGVKELYAL